MNASEAAKNALQYVLEAKENETITIFCDDAKKNIGEAFEKGAKALGLQTNLVILETSENVFRQDIPNHVLDFLTVRRPDIYVNIFRGIREETPFRIKVIHLETKDHKTRMGHCPGVTVDMLTQGALALTASEHKQMQDFSENLMAKLRQAARIEISSPMGTNLTLSVEERPFFTDTKLDWKLMKWMNLPTGEVLVAPVEDTLEGKFVCDLAVGGIGPLNTPVILDIRNGEVKNVSCTNVKVLERIQNSLDTDAMAKVVGEFVFGVNPKARFVEEFLEAEKILGTVHIAFGDNTDFPGGKNNSANHMDFLISKPTVKMVTKKDIRSNILVDGTFQKL